RRGIRRTDQPFEHVREGAVLRAQLRRNEAGLDGRDFRHGRVLRWEYGWTRNKASIHGTRQGGEWFAWPSCRRRMAVSSLRAKRSNPWRGLLKHGLLRRFAPRNDAETVMPVVKRSARRSRPRCGG